MSTRLFIDDILFYQRLLSCAGLYKGALNGKWSSAVDQADQDFASNFNRIAAQFGAFDPRSEAAMRTLLPVTQELARQFLSRAKANMPNCSVRIISGTRTYAEQDQLYKKGRYGSSERKVTNARGGQSNHNFGIAWDVGIFKDGKYLTGDSKAEIKIYKDLAAVALSDDLEWGGDWTSFVDMPHYQRKLDVPLKQIREKFEAGRAF